MHIAFMIISVSLLLVRPLVLTAQAQHSQVGYRQRARVMTCTPTCQWAHQGILVRWTADSLTIVEDEATISLPHSVVVAVDVDVHQGFEGTPALWGAMLGAVAFGGAAQASGVRVGARQRPLTIEAGAIGAGWGALFAGGGGHARRGAGIGFAIGAVVGATGGMAFCAFSPSGGLLSCPVEVGAAYGALVAGSIGATVGLVVGALDRHRWQRISADGMRVTPVATPDGRIGFIGHLRF
jgi:hypothetical protein